MPSVKRTFVIIAAFALLAAGAVPACLAGFCCAMPATASIHANMPCCAGEQSMAPRESKPTAAVTIAVIAPAQPTTAVSVIAAARVPASHALDADIHREPPPSPYLLHAQFRI